MAAADRDPVRVVALVIAIAAGCALLLALRAQTVTTKSVSDLFVFLDGAYRVVSGQVPNRDFHTALGPVTSYLPAAGYWLSGHLGAALPVGMALLILGLAPVLAHILSSRLSLAIAVPFAALLIVILAVPMNLGEAVTALSFAHFYNRIGWAALAALLIMYLRPKQPARRGLDALSAALLTLLLIYTKITYGLVALGFLVLLLLEGRQRRWAGLALVITLAAALAIEALWGASAAHLDDLLLTARVSGGLRGSSGQIIDHVLGNLADYVLLSLFAGLALWRTRSFRDVLFYAFCAVSGFLIINQNFQAWGIITIHAAAAVAAETILRAPDASPEPAGQRWSATAGAKLLFLALVLPIVVHCTIALGLHAGAASMRAGEEIRLANLDRVRLVNLGADYDASATYLAAVRDGALALSSLDPRPSRVFVLDVANPFSVGLGLEPPSGDSSALLWDRTVDATNFVPSDQLLAGVEVVMTPKPEGPATSDPNKEEEKSLRTVYGPFIAAHFDPVRETKHWIVSCRREPGSGTGDAGPCGSGSARPDKGHAPLRAAGP